MFNLRPIPPHMEDSPIFRNEDLSILHKFKLKRSQDHGINSMRWTYEAVASLIYKSHPQPSHFMTQLTKSAFDNRQGAKHGRFVRNGDEIICVVSSYCNCVKDVVLQRRFVVEDEPMLEYLNELFDARGE